MNKEDVLSIRDWIKISIKFSGTCMNCKKRLNSGDYGYWSRTSKSILHESCYNSLFLPSSDIKELNDGGSSDRIYVDGKNRSNKSVNLYDNAETADTDVVSNSVIKKREKKIKCYICNTYIDFNNNLIVSLSKLSEKYNNNSSVFYCYDCLENFSSAIMENYKKKFLTQF
jgi:hypothetical protein